MTDSKCGLAAWLLSALWLTSSFVFASDATSDADLRARVQRYLTSYFQLAPQESLTVDEIWSVENPSLWGLAITKKQAGKTSTDVYMLSKDLKTLSLGRVLDFTRDLDAENLEKVNLNNAPFRGPDNAAVTLITYCDLQCPDCKEMSANLRRVLPGYGDKVRLMFKNFPLMSRHAWAEPAAIAARCAYIQRADAFWNFYDFFYLQQDSVTTKNVRDKAITVAREAGLDTNAFAQCFDTKTTASAIQGDLYEANKLGVRGTPTILVNGRFISNEEMTEKDYRELIDEALASQKR